MHSPLHPSVFYLPMQFPKGSVEAGGDAAPRTALCMLIRKHILWCPWIFSLAAIKGALHQLWVLEKALWSETLATVLADTMEDENVEWSKLVQPVILLYHPGNEQDASPVQCKHELWVYQVKVYN